MKLVNQNSEVIQMKCPEDNKEKKIKKDGVSLQIKAEGYYCDECMKVYAVFEEK